MEDKDKSFEVEKKNGQKIIMSYADIAALLLNPNFNGLIRRLKVGESIYHNDSMANFERIK